MKFSRVKEIEDYIISKESVTMDELCKVFDVSKNTIRRDIKILADKGSISKIYGGVTANTNNNLLSLFEERELENPQQKERIGRMAASFIKENDIIFIDSGTTTVQMLEHVKSIQNLTVITNNLKALNILFSMENVIVITLGGSLIRKTSSFAGMDAITMLKNYNITKCFMAATGVSINSGLTNSTTLEFELKKVVIEKSKEVFLLADTTKFDVASLMTYCPLAEVDYLITDKPPADKYLDYFKKHSIELVLA